MKALCIGHAAYDITLVLDNYPKENVKYRVNESVTCGGGPASNAAFLLSSWGIKTYFAGVIGKDEFGKRIIKEFKSVKLNTKYLKIDSKNNTTISFVLINSLNGSRTIFTKKDKSMKLTKNIKLKPDLILVDAEELEVSKNAIKNNKNAISIIDAGRVRDETIELAKMVDYVVCSRDFVEGYLGIKIDLDNKLVLKDIFNKLEKEFKNVIITVESNGALYKKNDDVILVPSIKVKQIDSTGAGDIFHGAFSYCLLNGYDIEKSIMISNIAGALSVTKLGGRCSMPSLEEVMGVYSKCSKI